MDTNFQELFADLFAYRILLQDVYTNESDIIKKIKYKLYELGHDISTINDTIYNFYMFYNINVTYEEIHQSQVMLIMINNNFNETFINYISSNIVNDIQITNYNQTDNNDDENEIDNDDGNEMDNDDENENENEMDNDDVNNENIRNVLLSLINYSNNNNNIINNSNNINYNRFNNILNLVNVIRNIDVDSFNNVNDDNDDNDDKLSEEQLNSINTSKYYNCDEMCSICFESFDKDVDIYDIPCKHKFHINCLKTHLLNYNKKCPMCRNNCI